MSFIQNLYPTSVAQFLDKPAAEKSDELKTISPFINETNEKITQFLSKSQNLNAEELGVLEQLSVKLLELNNKMEERYPHTLPHFNSEQITSFLDSVKQAKAPKDIRQTVSEFFKARGMQDENLIKRTVHYFNLTTGTSTEAEKFAKEYVKEFVNAREQHKLGNQAFIELFEALKPQTDDKYHPFIDAVVKELKQEGEPDWLKNWESEPEAVPLAKLIQAKGVVEPDAIQPILAAFLNVKWSDSADLKDNLEDLKQAIEKSGLKIELFKDIFQQLKVQFPLEKELFERLEPFTAREEVPEWPIFKKMPEALPLYTLLKVKGVETENIHQILIDYLNLKRSHQMDIKGNLEVLRNHIQSTNLSNESVKEIFQKLKEQFPQEKEIFQRLEPLTSPKIEEKKKLFNW